jgi:hypothetical protein
MHVVSKVLTKPVVRVKTETTNMHPILSEIVTSRTWSVQHLELISRYRTETGGMITQVIRQCLVTYEQALLAYSRGASGYFLTESLKLTAAQSFNSLQVASGLSPLLIAANSSSSR